MDDPKKQPEAAQRTADEAEEKLALERQRVTRALEKREAATERLKTSDPDTAEFGEALAARGLCDDLLEALQARVAETERSSEAAQADLTVATLAAAQAKLRKRKAERQAASDAGVERVRKFVREFTSWLQAHHEDARSDATRELERAAGETLPTTAADRFTDPAHAVATVIAMLRSEEAEARWLASDGPRRQEEALRLEHERTAQRIAELNYEGNLDQAPSRVRTATLGEG